jgi:hypothetical protein
MTDNPEMRAMRSATPTLIQAMFLLSRDIQSDDGVANAAIYEAARRLSELRQLLAECAAVVRASAQSVQEQECAQARPRQLDFLVKRLDREFEDLMAPQAAAATKGAKPPSGPC